MYNFLRSYYNKWAAKSISNGVNMFRRLLLASVIISILILNLAACSANPPQQQAPQYDPAKNYAAFLVVNTPQSADALKAAKEKSARESYEIGPVVYYEPGTQDFVPLVKKLTPSKQVSLIWVVGSLLDTPNIQKAMAAAEIKGYLRYMPVTAPATP
jgi:hypothetical protein